uniref:Protein GAMETE CELL DEFECTIVE 1, mitochondrial n=1 Tax=Noccaea caerulescens TaxID=107243 RepID=A0A1J3F756_NOCCA
MFHLRRIIPRLYSVSASGSLIDNAPKIFQSLGNRAFSGKSGFDGVGGNGDNGGWDISTGGSFGGAGSGDLDWDNKSMWSTGLSKEHFDGVTVGRQKNASDDSGGGGDVMSKLGPKEVAMVNEMNEYDDMIKEIEQDNRHSRAFVDGIKNRMMEMSVLLKQVKEPGARGAYLKDSEKTEMYRLHKENPEVYTIERLAKDYRIMRQRVHAILFLKEDEEEEERKLGRPLDDSVERLLDEYPEFFVSHDREFHVASLKYKPEFKVMPEGWDGTIKDMDEVHYEISKKEDDMLYEEFVRRFEFNKMKWKGEVKCHKYSRRRSSDGWKITVEKMGAQGKRGSGGGWKFVSLPDGSSRPLNEMEKMYVKRETPRRRRKILP